jgi:ABC-type lipoprotein export system ATPase subunit
MDFLIYLKGVKKRYGSTEVLRGINFVLKKGEFVGIFGPSGSGKTTFLHIAGGLEEPTEGEVYLFGRRIDNLPEAERDRFRRGRVAYIFQNPYLLEDFSVEENLTIFGELAGRKNLSDEVGSILKMLKLEHRRKFKPYQLSGGEQQRVAIGRALISGAKFILADEPTGNLDERQAVEIFDHFGFLNKRGYTFLVVTHNTFLKKFFHKTYYIAGGLISDKLPV